MNHRIKISSDKKFKLKIILKLNKIYHLNKTNKQKKNFINQCYHCVNKNYFKVNLKNKLKIKTIKSIITKI